MVWSDPVYINKDIVSSYFVISSLDFLVAVSHLVDDKYTKWMKLFADWLNVFSRNKYNVGLTTELYKICMSDMTPIKSYVPRQTPAMIEAINSEMDKMIEADFIELLKSPFAAPTVCVKKKDNSLCVTIDFRMVNKNVINNAYPMHRIDNQLDAMSGCSVFTTLDLTKGYHQMRLDEESKEITAFTSPKGLYQWKVLPMGMKTSGAVFQRLMDNMLGDLQPRCAVVYIR